MVMAGCMNRDHVDEVRVRHVHVWQVGHGAVLVSHVRGDRMVFTVRKKVSSSESSNLTFAVGFFT